MNRLAHQGWHWVIGGITDAAPADMSRAWSSATGAWVVEFPPDEITRIASEAELTDVLRFYGLPGPLVTLDDVVAERTRRLALGFEYDFEDGRGVHHIGTTAADMAGWDEVSQASLAAIALGTPAAEIQIVTDTGQVTVTALEWQEIVSAATGVRQTIWHASFALQALDPVPADFADDSRWI